LNSASRYQGQRTTLPIALSSLELEKFMALSRNLDPSCSGYLNYRQLLTYFILMSSPVPTEKQVAAL